MVFASKFDLVQDKEADILLHLFSLLLKNLADPSQNPKLREELKEKAAEQEKKKLLDGELNEDTSNHTSNQDNVSQVPVSLGGFSEQICDSKDNPLRQEEHMEQNGLENHSSLPPSSTVLPPPPSSSILPPSEEMVMDTDPTKPPTDWLGGMRISAT